jgi:hypothetical protein
MTSEGCPQCGTTYGEAHQPTCRWRTPDGVAGEVESVGEPEWIVNDIGELGVRVGGRCFFLYKGESLEYGSSEEEIARGVALHDEGDPMRFRRVQKREFGETQWPDVWLQAGRREDRYCAGDGWRDLPARKPTPAPGEAPRADPFSPRALVLDLERELRKRGDATTSDEIGAGLHEAADLVYALASHPALSAARPAAPVTEAMVDDMARRLYEAENSSPTCWPWDHSGLDDEHPQARGRYRRLARAALAARGPVTEITEAMVEAAVRSLCSSAGKHIYTAFRNDRLLEVAVADALKAALAARDPA